MGKAILVLTNTQDGIHSDIVITKLLKCGEQVFRMDSDRLTKGTLRVHFLADSHKTGFVFEDNINSITSDEIGSVWYRRPNYFDFKISDPVQKSYAEREIISFLDGLWTLIPENVFWLSKPRALEHARKKIYQLELARAMGLTIPKTLVSNNPLEVQEFYRSCGGHIIFKAIYDEFLDYGEKAFNIPTTLITPTHLARLDLIHTLPGLFQEFIEKKYELRVTVVGDRIFSAKIDSRSNSLALIDWRNPTCVKDLQYSTTQLPNEISEVCLKMLDKLDIKFGAFDFAVDIKDEIYFFEVNPNGQWYWLEDRIGILVSDAVVDILKSERR